MSSKVTAKLPLGAACSVLFISLALLAGCKQEAPVDNNSYAPPGYGASVGPLTDTVWKNGSDTIKFGAEGKVTTVPSSWKKYEEPKTGFVEYGDFTYGKDFSEYTIYAKVTDVQIDDPLMQTILDIKKGDINKHATFTVPRTASIQIPNEYGSSTTQKKYYYEMEVKIGDEYTSFTMENKPNSEDKFVGTYYDEQGRKEIQINKDGTFVQFTDGSQSVKYWEYNSDGTISVQSTPFTDNPGSMGSSTTTNPTIYYLYPHALMRDGSSTPEAYK